MHEWQRQLLKQLEGKTAGEMNIIMHGRQFGKSAIAQMWNIMQDMQDPKYTELSKATVDGAMWYTVQCSKPVANWIRKEYGDHEQWHEHIDSNWNVYFHTFDMHEEFYMLLKLRWGC